MHVVLAGDSIFDNAPYVDSGESVFALLSKALGDSTVTLIAVDGDITTDVQAQLESFPLNATHVFVSCGGNDALRSATILDKSASSVGEALEMLHEIREEFRTNYTNMLRSLLARHSNLVVCTIYNRVPDLADSALTALALFNEIILEEAAKRRLPLIDLRSICHEHRDYSPASPIEPSLHGGTKITNTIKRVLETHQFGEQESRVYA